MKGITYVAQAGNETLIDCILFENVGGNYFEREQKTRSSWLNCALRDDEAVYWVSIGHFKAVAVGN